MNGLFVVEERVGDTLSDLIDLDEYGSYIPDVIRRVLRFCYDTRGTYCDADLLYDDRLTWRTRVNPNPSMLDSLAMFYEVLSTQQAPSATNVSQSSWHSRERVALTGVYYPDATTVRHRLQDFYNLPGGALGSVEFDTLITPHGEYISADMFFDFCRRVVDSCGSEFTEFYFSNTMINNQGHLVGQGPLTHFELRFSNFTADDNHASYDLQIIARGTLDIYGRWFGTKTRYKTTVFRNKKLPWCLTISQSVAESITSGDLDNAPWDQPPSGNWHNDARVAQYGYWDKGPIPARLKTIMEHLPVSIMSCAPALYHTQSRAYSSLLGNVSKNFESLIESPEFLGIIFQVAKNASDGFAKFIPPQYFTTLQKVRFVIHMVCGLYLGWIFAVSPALQSARDAFERFLKDTRGFSGKGALDFEGTSSTIEDLPVGLRDLLHRVVPDDSIERYKIRFGSQLYARPAADKVIGVIDKIIDDASRLGIEPNPVYLYQMQPFTFVLDWFVPLGALMQDAYNRFKLTHARGVVAGHSVSITLTVNCGFTVVVYLRSEATLSMIDPQADSWLTSSVPASVAIPLAAVLLL
jgi:hypothetical protein